MKNFKYYLLELAVIIAGITISFMAEEWRNNSNLVSQTEQILERLLVSLDSDIDELNYNIKSHEIASQSCSKIINSLYHENDEISLDSLSYILADLIRGTIFVPNEEEYNSLKNSGQIELIKDISLVQSLHSKYMLHPFYREINNIINSHINNYAVPYLIDQKGIIPPGYAGELFAPLEFSEIPDLTEISYLVSLLNELHLFHNVKAKELILQTNKLKQNIQEYLND